MALTSRQGHGTIDFPGIQKKGSAEIMALRKEDVSASDKWAAPSMKRSRITIDVSPELRRRIKIAAVQNDLSIGEYLGEILEQAVPKDTIIIQQRHYATPETLQKVLRVRERLMQESKGELFEDSAESLRKQRQERTEYLEQIGTQE